MKMHSKRILGAGGGFVLSRIVNLECTEGVFDAMEIHDEAICGRILNCKNQMSRIQIKKKITVF